MKKVLVALCAVALLGLTACKKDDPTPANNNPGTVVNPGNNDAVPDAPGQPGIFNPSAKIATVSLDGSLSETWNWEQGRLSSVTDADGSEQVHFLYDNQGRVSTMVLNGDGQLSGTVSFSYANNNVERISLVNEGAELLGADVTYNGTKVSKATLDMSDNMILDIFNDLIVQYLGTALNVDLTGTSIENVQGNVNFRWNGDDVNLIVTNVSGRIKSTIGQVAPLIANVSLFSNYAGAIQELAEHFPNNKVYLSLTLVDSAEYTYNTNYFNPMRRYLGKLFTMEDDLPRVEVAAFSTHPVATEHHHGNATATLSVEFVTNYPTALPPYTMALPGNDMSYIYSTTRSDKRPESVAYDIHTKTYTYKAN